MNSSAPHKLILLALCLIGLSTSEARAHPYMPVAEGWVASFDYSFSIDRPGKDMRKSDVHGTFTAAGKDWEVRGSKKYLHYVTAYKDIPYMKEDSSVWRREQDGKLLMGFVPPGGEFRETTELPASVEVGTEWEYDDGVPSKRKVVGKSEVELPNGAKLADCVEIVRLGPASSPLKDVTESNFYCRDLGVVRSKFVQKTPVGDYKTETVRNKIDTAAK